MHVLLYIFCWMMVIFTGVLHEFSIFSYKMYVIFIEFVYIFDWILGFICHDMQYFNFLYDFFMILLNIYMFLELNFGKLCTFSEDFICFFHIICNLFHVLDDDLYVYWVIFGKIGNIFKVFACCFGWFCVSYGIRTII